MMASVGAGFTVGANVAAVGVLKAICRALLATSSLPPPFGTLRQRRSKPRLYIIHLARDVRNLSFCAIRWLDFGWRCYRFGNVRPRGDAGERVRL